MRRGMGVISFTVLTVCLVFISAFCIKGTVMSQSKSGGKELESYYRAQEKELVQDTREYLNAAGFQNSGVTLTSVTDADGSREYTITVHHDRIDRMEESDRKLLKEELSALTFTAENCSFFHEFLVTD